MDFKGRELARPEAECAKRCIDKHFKVIEMVGKQYQHYQDAQQDAAGSGLGGMKP
jgi:hypothetical protein